MAREGREEHDVGEEAGEADEDEDEVQVDDGVAVDHLLRLGADPHLHLFQGRCSTSRGTT
eukprot:SAG11_NODE_59_length_19156_cov_11.188750_4_plen_60_part_00